MGKPEFRELAVEQLVECPHNPRKRFDATAMAELVASVRDHGVLTPLLVRPTPAKKGRPDGYEIGAGHRRYRAAKEAGVATVPAIVREMTDEEFIELLNLENLQREDLDPLEEAEGYRQLLALPGRDVHTVAAQVSRSTKYVYDRVKLLDLVEEAQELLVTGAISAGHAILIARLKPDAQRFVLEDGLWTPERLEARLYEEEKEDEEIGSRKAVSVRELASWIDAKVRFDRDAVDPMVHPATAETLTAAQEAEEPEQVVPITALHALPPSARADERTLCRQSWKRADGQPELDHYDRKPTKACAHSVLGVVVVGPGRGQAFRVCSAKKDCKVHWPENKAAKARASKQRDSYAKQQERYRREEVRRDEERKAWKALLPRVSEAFSAALATAEATPRGAIGKLIASECGVKTLAGKTAEDLVRSLATALMQRRVVRSTWTCGRDLAIPARLLKVDLKSLQTSAQEPQKRARKKRPAKKRGRTKRPRA